MDTSTNTIMIIGAKETFIIRVLLKKLADAGLHANFVPFDVEQINLLWKVTSLVTFYMEGEEELPKDVRAYLTDHMQDDDKQIVLIGEPRETASVKEQLPGELIYKTLPRPLDYDEYIGTVNTYLQQSDSGDLKKSILIIDDDPNYMSLVREWLHDTYKVSMATSGLRGIKWLGSNKADLILLDYEMPVTDGPQVLEMLRADVDTREIPVMFLTGRGDKDSVMSVMALKPEGYFLKTIGKDELMNKLKLFFVSKDA